jgi:purine-binding chemotaxis protein CheW
MYTNKTKLDSRLDLTLYIEGLFQQEEEDNVETSSEIIAPIDIIDAKCEAGNDDVKEKISTSSQIPVWGETPFKCLLIKIVGMNFMIPAMSVSYVERVDKKITRIPIKVDSFRGVILLREKSLAVIDLFNLIAEDMVVDNAKSPQITSNYLDHVLVMGKGGYALACDHVSEMITLNTEDVRWHGASFITPLYAGVVKEYLCPLINVDSLFRHVSAMPFVKSSNENNH